MNREQSKDTKELVRKCWDHLSEGRDEFEDLWQ